MIVHLLSGLVVVASAATFIGFTALVFVRRAVAEGFLRKFVSSARTHFIEQIFRALLGVSLVIYSSEMWQAEIFRVFGWVIVVTAVVLMLLPWQWHQRLGKIELPIMIRYLRLYAICVFSMGAVILYAVVAPQLIGKV
jgi:hypothetical protein